MRLITKNGEIELPEDFSFEVERSNPFLTEEGDATVPATIPASPRNLRILNNLHRIDKADRFIKKVPAILQHGAFNKQGQLIIDTVNKRNGIAVSFAIENSDVYSQYKNKSLKEITANKVRDDWDTIDDLIKHLENCAFKYKYNSANRPDYDVFPIAVSKYEDANGNIVYQYNNEVHYPHVFPKLVSDARIVHEADYDMSVPQGYGLSPFIYLNRAIDIIFEEMGYAVITNCFSASPLNQLVILNNCADTCVKGKIQYSDMFPSCTLSDFIDFLKNKFGVAIRVDSSSKKVWIEFIQDILSNKTFDLDISDISASDMDMTINDSSRVILSSEVSMEGTAPASDTLDDLLNRYGCYVEIDESEFANIGGPAQLVYDCLIKRKKTGVFYELRRRFKDGKQYMVRLGTDNFKYDRKNSDNEETMDSPDVIPAYLDKEDVLYVGDRIHYHTSFNNKQEATDQNLMICWGYKHNTFMYEYHPKGVLSKYTDDGSIQSFPFSLNSTDMYDHFWSKYNNLLLNNKVTVKGRVNYSAKDLANLNMTKPKYYKGQILLPVRCSFNLGKNKEVNDSEFILVKEFNNQLVDNPILPSAAPLLKWTKAGGAQMQSNWWSLFGYFPFYCVDLGNDETIILNKQEYDAGYHGYPIMWTCELHDIDIILTGDTNVFLGPPTFYGQESVRYNLNYRLRARYAFYDNIGSPTQYGIDNVESRIHSYESWYSGMDLIYFVARTV